MLLSKVKLLLVVDFDDDVLIVVVEDDDEDIDGNKNRRKSCRLYCTLRKLNNAMHVMSTE